MSGSRIKTLVIAALVLLNVFFLTVIVMDAAADARNERQAIENVCIVLRAGGLIIDPGDIQADRSLRTMRTARGDSAEEAIVRAILGPTEMTVQGMIHLYENPDRGIAEFYSGGDFRISLVDGPAAGERGSIPAVRRLLGEMGLETSDLVLEIRQSGETVTAVSSYRGTRIFNCTIDFVYANGILETVAGRYVTDVEPSEEGAGISHVGTALLSFLTAVRSDDREDVVCTRIDSVTAGFQHQVVGSFGEGVMMPVWLIITDMGSYIVVDATGEVLPVIQGIDPQGARIRR